MSEYRTTAAIIATIMKHRYVLPDIAECVCDYLLACSEDDVYGVLEAEAVAALLTDGLRSASDDLSLRVRYSAEHTN